MRCGGQTAAVEAAGGGGGQAGAALLPQAPRDMPPGHRLALPLGVSHERPLKRWRQPGEQQEPPWRGVSRRVGRAVPPHGTPHREARLRPARRWPSPRRGTLALEGRRPAPGPAASAGARVPPAFPPSCSFFLTVTS